MRMMKFAGLMLAVALVLAACGTSNKNNGAKETASGSSAKPEATQEASPSPDKVEQKQTIKGITLIWGNPPPADGPGQKLLNEKFNVDYKVEKVPVENYVEKLTAVVSGGDMPDMVGFVPEFGMLFDKWAKQGAFLEIDDSIISKYPSLQAIPDALWDQFKVNGKIYGIPSWEPEQGVSFMIRKDWLKKLNLPTPTSYEELKQVAIAFAKNDPDGNGKPDTYGIAIGQGVSPEFSMGPYWQGGTWYHKDKDGNFIPGMISEGRKEVIQFLADLYKEKAISTDFAVTNWADTNKQFYSGKAGVFLVAPRGMSQDYMNSLLEINPDAEFEVLAPFKQPDGYQGFTAMSWDCRFNAFNAELAKDPEKLAKILDMHEFSRKFYPSAEQNAGNKDFDFFYGGENVGYKMEDGKRVILNPEQGLSPYLYFQDSTNWIPADADPEFDKAYTEPKLVQATKDLLQLNKDMKHYYAPDHGIVPDTLATKGADLNTFLTNEQTKMISGQRPVSDWDAMVQEYLDRGGAQLIKEMNQGIKERGYTDIVWR